MECGVGHWSVTGTTSYSTSVKRTGNRSLRINPTTSAARGTATLTAARVTVMRFYCRFDTHPTVTSMVAGTISGLNQFGMFYFTTSGKYCAGYDNSTTIDGNATGLTVSAGDGVFHLVEIRVDTTNNPPLIDLSIDGVSANQYNTLSLAGADQTGLILGNFYRAPTYDLYFDDVLASATSGDYPLGAGSVDHFIPTSDGTHNVAGTADFQRTLTGTDILNATTTAYQLIDDVPLESGASVDWINMILPPNATDYVECIFGPASGISTPTVAPRAVEVIAGYHQAGTGTGNMEIRMNDNGTTNAMYTATTVAGVTSVAYARKHYATGPAGAWTVVAGAGNFNNLRVRFGSPAAVDANPDQYLDCIMIEAEFAAVVSGRTTKNTRAWPLGMEIGMNWRSGGV